MSTTTNENHSEIGVIALVVLIPIIIIIGIIGFFSSYYVIDPGYSGVKITMGTMSQEVLPPGLWFKMPFLTSIREMDNRQETKEVSVSCFSSDLQQINIKLKVLYKVPQGSTIQILRDYQGDPFDSLIAPRLQESVKEATATKTAADIVKEREAIKAITLETGRIKIGNILTVQDIVIEDVALSGDLERAIEAKMVQQQEAEKAIFKLQQAKTDADTAIAVARGQAESIRIQGEALEKNPKLVDLKMVEKWNGVTPQVVGSGSNILLPMNGAK